MRVEVVQPVFFFSNPSQYPVIVRFGYYYNIGTCCTNYKYYIVAATFAVRLGVFVIKQNDKVYLKKAPQKNVQVSFSERILDLVCEVEEVSF